MSRQSKSPKKKSPSLEDFKFDPNGLSLKLSKNLITVFDGYRIHRTYDLTFIDKAINEGKVPQSFIRQWGTIRAVLHKLAAIGPKVPGVEQILNRKQYVSFLSMATITIVVPIILITWIFQVEWLAPFSLPLALITIVFVMVNFLFGGWANREVAWAIHNYVEANKALVSRERSVLKVWTQDLVDYVARTMRKTGEDPEKHYIKFFNNDYHNIEVLKEPSTFRKHYVVRIPL